MTPADDPGRGERWRAPSPARAHLALAAFALLLVVLTILAVAVVLTTIDTAIAHLGGSSALVTVILVLLGAGSVVLLAPALVGIRFALIARGATDIVAARVAGARARTWALGAIGYAAAALLIAGAGLFVFANDQAVARTFVFLPVIFGSFWLILGAFWTNVYIFCVAQILVLIWGLVIAIARMLPGEAGRPIRAIATGYTDIFRALPAIITIYLVGFGLPLAGVPVLGDLSLSHFAILALTLTYGAYVAEVYRSGIESIHWSQTAAARSLGLSYTQTLRFVVVPQAVRRIVPPLLNDFISLQKDTALVNVIGAIDAFNQAKIVASNHFNLSSVTTVALLFIVITIPQARLVDRLIARDQRRMRAGT
jgi:polar amino acid transport system permease protein